MISLQARRQDKIGRLMDSLKTYKTPCMSHSDSTTIEMSLYQNKEKMARGERQSVEEKIKAHNISIIGKSLPLRYNHFFGPIDSPQSVANAFNKSIDVHWNTSRETGDCLFVPFASTPDKFMLTIIIFDFSHFLLSKRKSS
ncbi:hypothetical protein PHYBLDRAFT_71911 [Phycomyces blakesleeanus NRRL 1555(-)]|uniref:Uncharacterized protein n=1 Tax=Phycomyces blakesleeanus (strain ATCC 8743b / DSM 1359 / FGSC 10004 / NBRC 33097 / NRRL 1555) TaxID=763407 RepID=A0A167JT74_PHYB8|nr:hypothetical protein PHYBLDRAFT_71911 [Phycomyces blakesleeanus NRRL 1555(-)]OAD66659.1 hypothetical protein PHYBLDRAFT_71911 [Phycomyces blakesleeanus NRRL 1555(-)]|eukprot:XP_018284699.1 hypothetical protein PHYBLDRAFT_71911 [Phycomyces blakesleeanus NRRL 1555(-)]